LLLDEYYSLSLSTSLSGRNASHGSAMGQPAPVFALSSLEHHNAHAISRNRAENSPLPLLPEMCFGTALAPGHSVHAAWEKQMLDPSLWSSVGERSLPSGLTYSGSEEKHHNTHQLCLLDRGSMWTPPPPHRLLTRAASSFLEWQIILDPCLFFHTRTEQ
jgi:hypothetical protein